MKVLFLVGISGAGKSTFSKQFLKDNPNYIRINRDDLRKCLVADINGYYQRKDINGLEQTVSNMVDEIIINAVDKNYNLLVDNTNLTAKYINLIQKSAEFHLESKPTLDFKFFDISVNEARKRVSERENYPSHISAETDYINKQYQQYVGIKKEILKNSLTTQN